MSIDYFKAAESTLSNLPLLKKSVGILEKRLERLIQKGAPKEPGSMDFGKPYVSSHDVNNTLNDLLAISEAQREIASTKAEIREIQSALRELPEEQRKVVTLFYMNGMSAEKIAEEIYVESEKTVYNIRNKGVYNFALLYFGVSAQRANGKK